MRVVDVTQWYSPVSGGIRTYLTEKARWAARHGVSHAAVVTGARGGIEHVAQSSFVRVRGVTPSRRWGYRIAPRASSVLAALEGLGPSVVVLHDALAFPHAVARWARGRGVVVAMVCHSDLALAAAGLSWPLRRPAAAVLGLVQARALRIPVAILVASETSRARVAARVGVPVVRSALGVDATTFAGAQPDPALRERIAPRGAKLLLYAGRVSSEKRVDLLPRMLADLDDSHVLAVAGAGAATGRLRADARRLGVEHRLVLLGHISDRPRLATIMASADCFVHPNPTEPFGLCPLEALAAGCRVVAPDAAGSAETLGGRGAVLVAPGDPRALADGVRRALEGPPPHDRAPDLSWDSAFRREWLLYDRLAAAR